MQQDPALRIAAADLQSAALCASLPMHTGRAIARHLRAYLERMLDGAVNFTWLSGLQLQWEPHLLPVFTPSAQRRLRAIGLLDTAATLSPIDLVGKTLTNVHDLTAMLGMLSPGPSPHQQSSPLELDLQAPLPLPRKRLQAKPFPLEASEKWRPDPLTPVTFVFSEHIRVAHTDARFAWLIHLLAKHAPSALVPPGAPVIHFPDICDRFGSPTLSAVAYALRDAVHSAAAMTVQEEISDVATRISRATRNRSRTTSQLTLRYGSDGTPRSLNDVAELFGITRQSIFNQLNIARSLCSKGDYVPALRRLADAVDERTGRTIESVERDLRPLLGPTQSLVGALQFAKDFFGIVPSTPLYSARPAGSPALRKYVGEAAALSSVGVLAALRDRFNSEGLCYVSDALASIHPGPDSPSATDALFDAVSADPSVVWLGPDRRWLLWLHPQSPLILTLLQVTHVAHPHPLSFADAADALRALLDRTSAPVQPSTELLRAAVPLLSHPAGLNLQPDAVLVSASADPVSHIPSKQRPIYECLVRLGGFARPEDFRRAIPALSDVSLADLDQRITSCCFVAPSPPGYLLRGWPHPDVHAHAPDSASRSYRVDGSTVHCYLTNSAAQRVRPADRLVYLPAPLPDLIDGVFAHGDRLWPDITVRDGRIHRLSPIATALGIPPGGRFHLVFDLADRQFRIPVDTPQGETPPPASRH